jgi:hypothetical protein
VETYGPATNTWSIKAIMPRGWAGFDSVYLNGLIYAFGGIDENGAITNRVQQYDPTNDVQ